MELRGNHSFLFWVKQKQSCKKVYGVGSTQPCLPAETCHSFLPHGIQVSISSAFHSSWCSAFLSTLNSVRPFTLMTLLPGIARICGLSLVIKEPLTHRSINTQIKYMCDPYRPNPSTSTTCYEKGMVLSYMADKWLFHVWLHLTCHLTLAGSFTPSGFCVLICQSLCHTVG